MENNKFYFISGILILLIGLFSGQNVKAATDVVPIPQSLKVGSKKENGIENGSRLTNYLVNIKWARVAEADYYKIVLHNKKTKATQTLQSNTNNYEMNLSEGSSYKIKVKAIKVKYLKNAKKKNISSSYTKVLNIDTPYEVEKNLTISVYHTGFDKLTDNLIVGAQNIGSRSLYIYDMTILSEGYDPLLVEPLKVENGRLVSKPFYTGSREIVPAIRNYFFPDNKILFTKATKLQFKVNDYDIKKTFLFEWNNNKTLITVIP